MAEQGTKRLMEMQMDELQSTYGKEGEKEKGKVRSNSEKDIELAKIYEDAWEYEQDLACFEAELEIVKGNELKDIADILAKSFPEEERDYKQELQTTLENAWTQLVEDDKTHPKEQLDLIKTSDFTEVVQKLNSAYPEYSGDFAGEIKEILINRWDILIAIKKDHIKEEMDEIKTMGLKPHFVKRIYKQVHGVS